MTFDKTEYWKNRNAGKRGQSDVPKQQLEGEAAEENAKRQKTGKHLVQVGPTTFFTNREQYRRIVKPWRDR